MRNSISKNNKNVTKIILSDQMTIHPILQTSFEKNEEKKGELKLRKKHARCLQRVHKTIGMRHIYNILDQIFINQQTIRDKENDQSLLKTLFYMRTIVQIETTSANVRMLLKSNEPSSNVPYIIERFNSFGDNYFHKLATHLEQIYAFFLSRQSASPSSTFQPSEANDLISKSIIQQFVRSVNGKAYFIKKFPNQYLFSNQLIQLLGNTVHNFTHDCLRYRVIIQDFFTSDNYPRLLEQNLLFLSYYIDFLKGNLSFDQMLSASDHSYICYLRTNQKRIKVALRAFLPNPYIFCMIIQEVISQEPLVPVYQTFSRQQKDEFDKILSIEKKDLMHRLNTIKYREENEIIRCGYIGKPRRRRRKSQRDFDF